MADLTQAPESAGDAIAFLGEWLADDVQTPTREEIKLARAVALALAEIRRLTTEPTPITTADQLRAVPVGTVLLEAPDDDVAVRYAWQIFEDHGRTYATFSGDPKEPWFFDQDAHVHTMLHYGPFRVLHTPGGDRA